MGVNGITPFLKRFCPEVLHNIPGRLKALKGKKIVLDGTLITQRFHYVQDPHPKRHVLGWYRLAKELHEAGVSAICLFDGKERSAAKSNEVQRRQKVRQLVHTRGMVEKERFQRIDGLKNALTTFAQLPDISKKDIAEAFVLSECVKSTSNSVLLQGQDLEKTGHSESKVASDNASANSEVETREISSTDPRYLLPSLYLNYCATVSQLASLAESTTSEITTPTNADEQAADHVVTKAQHELSVQESTLWRDLSLVFSDMASLPSPPSSPDTHLTPTPTMATEDYTTPINNIQSTLETIRDKSHAMSSSFDRRTNAPNEKTYSESKMILEAAGIPCIDATGAVEAEALASSIVLNGYADYVATEDTDVLVYEAPMLKNITARHEPLILVSGASVRHALGLNRKSYVDFALLLGTDFTQRIPNVGPARALSFIKQHGGIENVLQAEEKRAVPKLSREAYLAQVAIARLIFESLPPVPTSALVNAGFGMKNELADDKHGGEAEVGRWNDQEIRKILAEHSLEFVLLEMDLAGFDYTHALDGNYFGDNPHGG